MRWVIYILFFCSVLTFSFCTSASGKNMDEQNETEEFVLPQNTAVVELRDYMAFVEEPRNGLRKTKEIEDMVYTLQYTPLEYVIAMEKLKDTLSSEEVTKRKDELKDMQYFTLKIEAKNNNLELLRYKLESDEEYQDRVHYFSFDMQKDIYLMDGKDSIPCALYHFERNFGVAPYAKFVLGFETSQGNVIEDKKFSLNDRVFNVGRINIKINKNSIKSIPKIKTY